MVIAQSKLTMQGQISIPAEVRRRLGIGPGSVIEWNEEDGRILVRRVGRLSSEDIRTMVFPNGPPKRRSLKQLADGRRTYIKRRHARG